LVKVFKNISNFGYVHFIRTGFENHERNKENLHAGMNMQTANNKIRKNGKADFAFKIYLCIIGLFFLIVFNPSLLSFLSNYNSNNSNDNIGNSDRPGNDNFSTASIIYTGPISGSLSSSDMQDYYKISLEAGQYISILIHTYGSSGYGVKLYVYNPAQNLINSISSTPDLTYSFYASQPGD
jgi:hypothetical protein